MGFGLASDVTHQVATEVDVAAGTVEILQQLFEEENKKLELNLKQHIKIMKQLMKTMVIGANNTTFAFPEYKWIHHRTFVKVAIANTWPWYSDCCLLAILTNVQQYKCASKSSKR